MIKQNKEYEWAVYVACIGELRYAYRILVGKHEGRPRLAGKIMLEWILGK
jgi:hypothetical protein